MSTLYEAWMGIPKRRRKLMSLLGATTLFLLWLLWRTRSVLYPYLFGLGLAYILSPVVNLLERGGRWLARRRGLGFLRRAARPIAVVLTYLLFVSLLVGFFSLVVPLLGEQARTLWQEAPALWENVSRWGDNIVQQYRLLPPQVQAQIEKSMAELSAQVGEIVRQALEGTAIAISYTISLLLSIFIVPFWSFYLLKDAPQLRRSLLNSLPPTARDDAIHITRLLDGVFSAYLRGQLFLGLTIGLTYYIGLMVLGVNFSALLGLFAGVFELVPNIGPVIGAIPAVLVALTQDPSLALWVIGFAVIVQQIENLFLTPRVLGQSINLHPAVTMVVLVIGSELGGILGLFLAPVMTAMARDIFRYLYFRTAENPLPPPEALARVWSDEPFVLEV